MNFNAGRGSSGTYGAYLLHDDPLRAEEPLVFSMLSCTPNSIFIINGMLWSCSDWCCGWSSILMFLNGCLPKQVFWMDLLSDHMFWHTMLGLAKNWCWPWLFFLMPQDGCLLSVLDGSVCRSCYLAYNYAYRLVSFPLHHVISFCPFFNYILLLKCLHLFNTFPIQCLTWEWWIACKSI